MRQETGQFGSFDGQDNRKAVMDLFVRMGHGLDEASAARKRAWFLQSLLGDSRTGLNGRPLKVTPCGAVQAYHLFVAITGCLGVPIESAARKLENYVKTIH